jgi:CDP-diacylglycerol--glycerol-3-phosphate 3-phosphatidyltransferase
VLLWLAWADHRYTFVVVLALSFFTDALDGFLARALHQTSEFGAKLDSWGDFAIYLTIPVSAWWLWPDIVRREAVYFIAVLASILVPPAVAFVKFRQTSSYHTWGTKFAVLVVGLSLLWLFIGGDAWPFRIAAPIALAAALEEIAITLVLHESRSNVRSLWHVLKG